MATNTDNYGLIKPAQEDFYNVEEFNENADKVDATLAGLDPAVNGDKAAPADTDKLLLSDTADGNKTKRVLWSAIKSALGKAFAAIKHTHAIADIADLVSQLSNKANIEKQSEHEISFSTGIQKIYRSTYSINPFGMVIINVSCAKEDGSYFTHLEAITSLPEGFRPPETVEVSGTAEAQGVKTGCTFYISANGRISISITGISNVTKCYFNDSFIVA